MTPEKRELVEASFNRSETLKFYNASLIECETDYVSIKIPKQEMMTRKHGMFNGAMIASLVDVSSGYAAVVLRIHRSPACVAYSAWLSFYSF